MSLFLYFCVKVVDLAIIYLFVKLVFGRVDGWAELQVGDEKRRREGAEEKAHRMVRRASQDRQDVLVAAQDAQDKSAREAHQLQDIPRCRYLCARRFTVFLKTNSKTQIN